MSKSATLAQLSAQRLIALAPVTSAEELIALAHALLAGGIHAVELPLTAPILPEWIAAAVREIPEFSFGLGTVIDAETTRRAILAGVRFISTPALRPEVILLCRRYQLPVICGVHAASEMAAALSAGADAIKLYPSQDRFGPTHVREVRAAYPNARLFPVGGVTAENVADFVACGADAVFAASALVSPHLAITEQLAAITTRAQAFVAALPEFAKQS